MGKVKSFAVEFKNNRLVYAPGDILEGMVNVGLKKQRKIKKIKVNCTGLCEVKVKAGSDVLKCSEKYFTYDFDVHSGDTELSTGDHKFPFQIQLPPNLPTSFEGDGGHVRYSIQAIIEYPGAFSGKTKCMIAFTIIDSVDLNLMPECKQPVRLFCERKSSGALFWKKAPVSLNLSADKQGFVSGEHVKLSGIIANGSSRELKMFKLTLTQAVSYFGRRHGTSETSTPEKHTVSKVVATGLPKEQIHANKSLVWEKNSVLYIPALVPSGLKHCRIIDVVYSLQVSCMIQGNIVDEYIKSPSQIITIGSIPLFTHEFPMAPVPHPSVLPSAPPMLLDPNPGYAPPPYEPGTATAPPLPSYEEACTGGASISMGQSDQDELVQNQTSFTPQYAVYANWEPATNPTYHG